jgi:predicted TPR repeat methyltransferase
MPNVYTFKDFEGSSHRILIDLITRYSNGARTLLDLGAAGGELGQALRNKFKRTIGFEYDVDRIGDLHGRFDQVVIADLETVRRLPNHPDTIVLADILEHLKNPRTLLECVREALPPEGHVFVSVPNIANVTVRIGLLLGIFEYRERGILDSSHLRFYTMRAIKRDVEGAGFRIIAIRGSSVPIRLIVPKAPEFLLRIGERMLTIVTRIWRALFAYQIIIVAQRDS